jgi:hypothetical protein
MLCLSTQAERLEASIKEARAATDRVQKEYNALNEKARPGLGCPSHGLQPAHNQLGGVA